MVEGGLVTQGLPLTVTFTCAVMENHQANTKHRKPSRASKVEREREGAARDLSDCLTDLAQRVERE